MGSIREIKRIKGSNIGRLLVEVVERHNRLKNSYFWTPSGTARGRRWEEKRNSQAKFEFVHGGKRYSVEQVVECSCRNYYYTLYVYVDGKRADVRAIKRLLA